MTKVNTFAITLMYLQENPWTGLSIYAEKLNACLAMIGFVSLLVEIPTGNIEIDKSGDSDHDLYYRVRSKHFP